MATRQNSIGIGRFLRLCLSKRLTVQGLVEYTPQSYSPSDMDMFFKNFSSSQVGQRPKFVAIDGGMLDQAPQTLEDHPNMLFSSGVARYHGRGLQR